MITGNALRSCEVVHVRDDRSLAVAESLGCRNVRVGSDLVMTLKPDTYSSRKDYMLVNLRPCRELEAFVKVIAPVISSAKIPVIGAALSDEDTDALALLILPEVVRVKSFREAASLWSKASCAVGMRLHFGVLSRIFRTPLALMPYDEKVSSFASQSGVPCILDEWREPVMPLPVPECAHEIDSICREVMAL